ncbi:mycofactocin biosynthesis glycosyltransferase MftF [Carbonactinospora thermoautotrophica]|uniref:mycofactocin biosynthesis glycosyltransferase MftF n=1 Tax=Carbonactinospora thermoautotrophica TaxID=1469144 RepID=UPI0022715AD1|nr:mycofactocin biosynthesis glycosyltransferase MftF [Carbonactinospora thermoautotrophica]
MPADFMVAIDPSVRALDGGRTLLGGSPLRMVRLSPAAARAFKRLEAGEHVGRGVGQRLARWLLDAGFAHPRPGAATVTPHQVTVVVPVRDRPDALRRCLAMVAGTCGEVIVVDDASERADRTEEIGREFGARVIRRPVQGGPAAARNTGLAHCRTDYVAFVDSDCVPSPNWLVSLLPHFRDPAVAAVAPRIVADHEAADGWLGAYEAVRSPLDLGPAEAPVMPRSRVAYVPAAALVVRREAAGDGFREDMLVGEDVDFVWRLYQSGWTVRYEPRSQVAHTHRTELLAWLARRCDYGSSAAPLALRHPGQVPPVAASGWSVAAWLLAAARRPLAGLGLTGLAAALLSRRLPVGEDKLVTAARLAGLGTFWAGRNLASGLTRAWWPVTVPLAVVSPTARRALLAAAVVPALAEWVQSRPRLDPGRFLLARILDDLAYGAGLWLGCHRHRTVAPLLPDLTSWPKPGRSRTVASGIASFPPVNVLRAGSDPAPGPDHARPAAPDPGPPLASPREESA